MWRLWSGGLRSCSLLALLVKSVSHAFEPCGVAVSCPGRWAFESQFVVVESQLSVVKLCVFVFVQVCVECGEGMM